MGGVRWREVLTGPMSFDQDDFNQAMLEGRRDGVYARLDITLEVDDVAEFERSPTKTAQVVGGCLDAPGLGGPLPVLDGTFEQFVQADDLLDHLHLRMRYRLMLEDPAGGLLCLDAFKLLENDPGYDSWSDTTTLFARIYRGREEVRAGEPPNAHADVPPRPLSGPIATAVLEITPVGFLRELTTFRGTAPEPSRRRRDVLRFQANFAKDVAKTYVGAPVGDGRPSFPRDRPARPWRHDPSEDWHPVPGREHADGAGRLALERKILPFDVPELAFPLNLHRVVRAGEREGDLAGRQPVLLAHGAGVRAEMFYGQPLRPTVVDRLLETGYDVWVLNWRASIDVPNVSYTLDQAARFDHPAAVRKVLELTGQPTLRALVHCQGSVSFTMAAVAGLLRDPDTKAELVTHIVSSAISLFFECSDQTWLKQRAVLPVFRVAAEGADPQWGIRSYTTTGPLVAALSRRVERPCGNVPCQIANYIYGSGWDVLLCHDNIDDEVHAWTARELGYTPLSLISQVAESHRNGHIVPAGPYDPGAPASYVGRPAPTSTRFTLLGCGRDTMFLPEGQRRTDRFLKANGIVSDYVEFPGYGHMDLYWGPHAAADAFPTMLRGLKWQGGELARPGRHRPPQKAVKPPPQPPRRRRLIGRRAQPAPAFSPPPPARAMHLAPGIDEV
jgi:hypothetical protein